LREDMPNKVTAYEEFTPHGKRTPIVLRLNYDGEKKNRYGDPRVLDIEVLGYKPRNSKKYRPVPKEDRRKIRTQALNYLSGLVPGGFSTVMLDLTFSDVCEAPYRSSREPEEVDETFFIDGVAIA